MVVVAGMVGAAGLGGVVVRGVTQLDIGTGFEGGLAVVILAIYLDRVTGAAGRRLQQRRRNTLRRRGSRHEQQATTAKLPTAA
ncbi:hypothetical protein [Saccharothrix deserti]|uniref:hypothetical protein n=1 Tax=Saccharothrix deserti TaxID=2593674 RepID=UPI00192E59A7